MDDQNRSIQRRRSLHRHSVVVSEVGCVVVWVWVWAVVDSEAGLEAVSEVDQ